jgi:hypothetical protein
MEGAERASASGVTMTDCTPLVDYLRRVPAIDPRIGHGAQGDRWWVKLVIDVRHPLAWRVVQELAHVLNYPSFPPPCVA